MHSSPLLYPSAAMWAQAGFFVCLLCPSTSMWQPNIPVHTTSMSPLHHVGAQIGLLIYQPSPSAAMGWHSHTPSHPWRQMVVQARLFLHTHTHLSCPIYGTRCHGYTYSHSWYVAVWEQEHSCLHPYRDPAMNYAARVWPFAYTLCLALTPGGYGTPVHASVTSLLCPGAPTQWHDHACVHDSL